MGNKPPQASLAAIKGLDSIPDISSQLQRAIDQCDHSARAEMILKWLAEKRNKTPEIRSQLAFWNLLSRATRLLNVEKLAASLAPLNFFDLIPLALNDTVDHPETLAQIASFCELLHQISSGSEGDALKAIFVTDSKTSSRLAGICISAASESVGNDETQSKESIIVEPLVRFAALVWELRKATIEDDTIFSTRCLIPAAGLHFRLSPNLYDINTLDTLEKRSHRGNGRTPSSDTTVATLIARHVFLPARAAFTKSAPGESDTAVLDARLDLLGPDNVGAKECSALFDVCCRSVALNTNKSRLRERPWLQAVFNALLAKCGDNGAFHCVQQLLAVVEKRAMIFTDRLVKISEAYMFSKNNGPAVLDLIAQIIRLDDDVYVEESRAMQLFDKITSSFRDSDEFDDYAEFVANQILTPVMQAFARHRSLSTFTDLWSQTLLQDTGYGGYFDWSCIVKGFSALVDNALSTTNVTELVRTNCKKIHQIAEDRKAATSNDKSKSLLAASVVALRGLIAGIRDEQVLDSLSPTLQALFTDLLSLVPHTSEDEWHHNKYLQHTWPLMNRSFAIWFPRLSSKQERPAIAEEVRTVIDSKGFRAAKKMVKAHPENGALARFIGAVLVFAPDEAVQSKDAEAISKPTVKGAKAATEAFIVEPRLLELCPEVLPGALSTGLDVAGAEEKQEPGASRAVSPLVSAAVSQSPVEATETVLEAVCTAAEASTKEPTVETAKRVLLSLRLLAELSPQLAAAKRRRVVVDHLLQIETSKDVDDQELCEEIEHRRLAALIQWVPFTNIDLESSPQERCAMFWRLAEHQNARSVQQTWLKLLEAALSAISARIYAAEAKSSEKGLQAEMAQKLETSTRKLSTSKAKSLDLGAAVAVRVAISDLEKYQVPGRSSIDPSATAQYVKHLLEVVQHGLDSGDSITRVVHLSTALDSLSQLPKQTLEACGVPIEAFQVQGRHCISQLFDIDSLPRSGAALEAHIAGFRMACGWSLFATEPTTLIKMATTLLGNQPQPDQLASILSHFRDFVRKEMDFSSRLDFTQDLLQSGSESTRLAHEMISTLQKTELDELGHVPQQHILHSVAKLAAKPSEQETSRQALACIITILREKHFLTNQHSLETTLYAVASIMRDASSRHAHIVAALRVFVVILQQHRARIQDRLNLVVCVLQASLSRLFKPASTTKEQGVTHAQMLARTLQLLCDPPATRQSMHGSDLVDEGRKTRAAVGRHVQNVLHHYCALVLSSPNPDVTEPLRPGLWAMIAAMEVNSEEAMKVLSAAMNNSERAVLRGVNEEYQRSAKWKGG